MKRRWFLGSALATPFLAPTLASAAAAIRWRGDLAQGALLVGTTAPGTRLALDGRAIRVAPTGQCVIGFPRDAPARAELRITTPDGATSAERLAIRRRQWQVQHIDGLPEGMVTPPDAVVARIQAEQARLNAVRRADTETTFFAEPLAWPATGRISGVYGSQRILNGQPRAPHLGLDIAVPVGTPIHAALGGRVAMAADLYFTGNTLLLDHGHGVTTLHAHLSRFEVEEGQQITRGQRVALSGATGRVTGPHLHYAVYCFATAVDPRPLLPSNAS